VPWSQHSWYRGENGLPWWSLIRILVTIYCVYSVFVCVWLLCLVFIMATYVLRRLSIITFWADPSLTLTYIAGWEHDAYVTMTSQWPARPLLILSIFIMFWIALERIFLSLYLCMAMMTCLIQRHTLYSLWVVSWFKLLSLNGLGSLVSHADMHALLIFHLLAQHTILHYLYCTMLFLLLLSAAKNCFPTTEPCGIISFILLPILLCASCILGAECDIFTTVAYIDFCEIHRTLQV